MKLKMSWLLPPCILLQANQHDAPLVVLKLAQSMSAAANFNNERTAFAAQLRRVLRALSIDGGVLTSVHISVSLDVKGSLVEERVRT